jgi:proteic killer suppression protein
MIRGWKHKGLRNFYLTGDKSGIIAEHASRLQIILQLLDAAVRPEQMHLPGLEFHKLKGNLKNYYAVKVRANWRIVFKFEDEDAILVDYMDYH